MNQERVMAKVKKCLALSKSATGNEAAVALRQAQRLMTKHGLTDEKVELSQVVSSETVAGWGISAPAYMMRLVGLVERTFGVIAVFQQRGRRTRTVMYFGVGCQPEVAAYASDVLRRQLLRDRRDYLKMQWRCKRANKSRRADLYAEAWVVAASETVHSFEQSLAVRSMIKRGIAEHVGELETATVRPRAYQDRDWAAASAGARDGRRAKLHRAAGFDARMGLERMSADAEEM